MLPPLARLAAPAQRTSAVPTLQTAFVADPVMRWMWPESGSYLTHVGRAQLALGGRAFDHEGAWMLEDSSGVALWLPPGVEVDGEAMAAVVDECVPGAVKPLLGHIVEQMGEFHPHEPHWYLAVLGVDASVQGKGRGAILMKEALARVDRDRLPAYLESSNPRNIPFYRRHGFEAVGEIRSGDSPVITPMLRLPRR